jgi:hypothetical protein
MRTQHKSRGTNGGRSARSVLECGGKRSATPLSDVTGPEEKLRRRCALPEQSKTCRLWQICFCFLLSALCFRAWGQSSIDWSTLNSGGGTSRERVASDK